MDVYRIKFCSYNRNLAKDVLPGDTDPYIPGSVMLHDKDLQMSQV